jgi:hypothetical protein
LHSGPARVAFGHIEGALVVTMLQCASHGFAVQLVNSVKGGNGIAEKRVMFPESKLAAAVHELEQIPLHRFQVAADLAGLDGGQLR